MVNQKRIALFVDIDNMPLNKKHIDNIITQLEKSGEIVYAKIYGVTDRRHREIICDAVARGFETVPPVYPTRRGSTKVFDIRILVDLCELIATNKSIDGVAIVANPAHQVYLFSRLKRNGIKIFACDNLDEDSAKFVDEVLSFGYNDPNSVSKSKKAKSGDEIVTETPAPQEQVEPQEQTEEPIVETVENADEPVEQPVEEIAEVDAVEEQSELVDVQLQDETVAYAEQAEEQPITEVIEEIVKAVEQEVAAVNEPVEEAKVVEQEVAQEQPQVLAQEPEQEEIVVEEIEPVEEEDDNLDILRQIQQIKQEVPSSDDEEDEALIEKIKQLLDEFN
ncbi:MAG: NYN domain-containing protein [Clostridia bacterium]|nr:NYN domain-containing protein [Clostridia bacterium]